MEGFSIPAPVRNATRTVESAATLLGTVIVTALVDVLTETAEASVKFVGVPEPVATLTFDVAMLDGTNVLDGKVTVIVPTPAVNGFCAVKFTVSVDAALTTFGETLTVMFVTAEVLDIV